jgi:hypothetical protein
VSLRYLRIPKFCVESGYTEKAVRRKIEEGVWLENRQFRRAPDGRFLIDVQGVERWVAAQWEPPLPSACLRFVRIPELRAENVPRARESIY